MNGKYANRKEHDGFTLMEMLVVILIIAILAGLISTAAIQARKRTKAAAIGMEIKQLSLALGNYKTQFGEYPPDFSDSSDTGKLAILRHLSRAFPRFVITGSTVAQQWQNLRDEIFTTTNNAVDIINGITLDPSTALRFWLGGMPDAQGRPIGFSQDPAHPFDNTSTSRIGPFFEFDPARLPSQPPSELGKYYPPGVPAGSGMPYVYFHAEQGQPQPKREYYNLSYSGNTPVYTFKPLDSLDPKPYKPYWDQRNMGWVNPDSFQILCCGLDGKFGKENVYPTGIIQKPITDPTLPADVLAALNTNIIRTIDNPGNFDHLDDQTNFTSGTIGDDIP